MYPASPYAVLVGPGLTCVMSGWRAWNASLVKAHKSGDHSSSPVKSVSISVSEGPLKLTLALRRHGSPPRSSAPRARRPGASEAAQVPLAVAVPDSETERCSDTHHLSHAAQTSRNNWLSTTVVRESELPTSGWRVSGVIGRPAPQIGLKKLLAHLPAPRCAAQAGTWHRGRPEQQWCASPPEG